MREAQRAERARGRAETKARHKEHKSTMTHQGGARQRPADGAEKKTALEHRKPTSPDHEAEAVLTAGRPADNRRTGNDERCGELALPCLPEAAAAQVETIGTVHNKKQKRKTTDAAAEPAGACALWLNSPAS